MPYDRWQRMVDPAGREALRQNVVDDLTFDQRQRSSLPIVKERVMVDAEQMVHRGQQVLGADGPVGYIARLLVRGANDLAASGPAAGNKRRVATRPVIAAA